MSRTAKEMIRMMLIAALAFLGLVALTFFAHVIFTSEVAQMVLVPFYLVWGVVVVGFCGIGPLAKRLNRAAIEDAAERRKSLEPKKPWE